MKKCLLKWENELELNQEKKVVKEKVKCLVCQGTGFIDEDQCICRL